MKNSVVTKLFEIQKLDLSAKRSKDNPFFKSKYVPLDKLWDVISPHCKEKGLSVIHYCD
jgi:hypothetical protein